MRYCNSLIIDYSPKTWINDFSNVIISKKCVDQELNNHIKGKNKKEKENDLNSFLFEYFPFYYYKLDKNNLNILKWKNQKLLGGMRCPFYHFDISGNNNKKECYSGECLHSTKFQFNYLKDVIKIIYYLKYNFNVDISIILNLIRYNIFHQTYFNLKYYNNNPNNRLSILSDIIECCGGQIYKEKENNNNNIKILFVCAEEDYSFFKDKIKKDLIIYENSKLINDKYIIDSFYFMTNLEKEIDSPEYSFE